MPRKQSKQTSTEIHYKAFGDTESKQKILILHGWGGKSESWIEAGEMLSKKGFEVIVPDLPGFGKTKLTQVYTLDLYAKTIEEFVENIKLDTHGLTLIGHSNGGAISIKLANRKNIDIKKLFLIGSAGIRNKRGVSIKRKICKYILTPIRFIKKLPGGKYLRTLFYKAIGSHDYINAENNPLLKKTFLNIIESDLQEEIPLIDLETTLIWGDKDTYTPLSDGKLMRGLIKKSKLLVLEGEKHGIHLQNPEILTQTILKNI